MPYDWRLDWKHPIYDDVISYGLERGNTMKKNFLVQGGYHYDTLADAVKEASRRASRDGTEYKVYQAVKLVAPKTPDVDVSDVVI